MAENATTTAKPLSAAVSPAQPVLVPGTRAAVMRAAADALRAAAADIEDPRTTPMGTTTTQRCRDVASWLRRRADLLQPPPPGPYERNARVRVELSRPELRPELRQAVAEALTVIGGQLGGYGIDTRQLAHLVDDLADAFAAADADRQARP